ncbi:MAG: hypothetical protein DRG63_12325 [Deltaproteobacteria bacterium]|nr:MAG: hypothetical protein DRG63_12325 [Deltaproteobacteria bacterium]
MNNIVILALALVVALLMGRVAAFVRIPKVTGYLLAGILLGPSVTEVLTKNCLGNYVIINEIALGMIAFYIGCEFESSHFKRLRKTVPYFSFTEILITIALVFLLLLIALHEAPAMALLLAILAIATAPAATILVIREYDSEGPLTNHILAMVGLNNLACIVFFVITLNLVSFTSFGAEKLSLLVVFTETARQLFIPPLMGVAIALFIRLYLRREIEQNELLLVSLSGIMLGAGLSHCFSVSPLLTNLVMGATLINSCDRTNMVVERLKQVDYPFYALFFVLAGASLHLEVLGEIGAAGVLYLLSRIAGKLIGVNLATKWRKTPEPNGIYLGMGLLSQAGLAIGLSSWAVKKVPLIGEPLMAVILGTTVVFEIIGPILARYSLIKGGEVKIVKLLSPATVGDFREDFYMLLDRVREALGISPSYMKGVYEGPVLVKHLMRHHIDTIPQNATLDKIVKIMEWSRYSTLPVVDEKGAWVGMVSLTDIRDLFFDKELGHLIIAKDIARPVTTVSPVDTLEHAMGIFELEQSSYLPVVKQGKNRHFLGVIHRRDVYLFRLDKGSVEEIEKNG